MDDPEHESVRTALRLAWEDYRHAREQTWKTVRIVAILGAGLVTVDAQCHDAIATLLAGFFLLAGVWGVLISITQRGGMRFARSFTSPISRNT